MAEEAVCPRKSITTEDEDDEEAVFIRDQDQKDVELFTSALANLEVSHTHSSRGPVARLLCAAGEGKEEEEAVFNRESITVGDPSFARIR